MRLQKYMAKCGVASRRKSEELISDGKVKVNGEIITELGYNVDENTDIVEFNNKIIQIEEKLVYIMLNKPTGYVTTVKDQFNRPTVLDLINNIDERIYPVGRLDYDTSGLLFLTNDGNLTYKITHPKHEFNKVYIAKLKGVPNKESIYNFKNGLKIDNYITSKANIEIIREFKDASLVKITIHEGRNRQIRKMCNEIGHPVIKLNRVSLGDINLGDLEIGKWRFLSDLEIEYLKNI